VLKNRSLVNCPIICRITFALNHCANKANSLIMICFSVSAFQTFSWIKLVSSVFKDLNVQMTTILIIVRVSVFGAKTKPNNYNVNGHSLNKMMANA